MPELRACRIVELDTSAFGTWLVAADPPLKSQSLIVAFLLLALLAVALVQIGMAIGLIRTLFAREVSPKRSNTVGHVMVILCLRGDDPFLTSCLAALMDQDYADYELRIIVDSESDPAWRSIEDSNVAGFHAVRIEVLRECPATCSLKNAALLQAIDDLDERVSAIALIDADTMAHRTWLSDLVAPLGEENVELTTGVRWYLPDRPSLGAMSRVVWNAAATIQMVQLGIPWGGSLALSRLAISRVEVSKHWALGLSEDTMMTNLLKQHGLKQRFVPSVIMINREDCRVGELLRWIKRQLVVARVYHPSWPSTVVHAILTAAVPGLCVLVMIGLLSVGDWRSAGGLAFGLIVFQTTMYVLLLFGLWLVDRKLWNDRRQSPGLTPSIALKIPAGMLLIQVLYPVAVILALRAKSVDWRGMHYHIGSDNSIGHEGHRPYAGVPKPSEQASL